MTKKRRRKKHYHTGVYASLKTGKNCKFRSGWELLFMEHLDADPNVVTWDYESMFIEYVSNAKTGRKRKYYPDFQVEYADGHKAIIEVKPSKRLHQLKVAKKLLAAGDHCRAHGLTFEVVTELELKVLGLM